MDTETEEGETMRLARIGDTISTKNVMQFGTMAGSKITIRLDNAESMREANRTILLTLAVDSRVFCR